MIKLLRKRRSIRRYKTKPLDKKMIAGLIEAALRAPSSRNNRPCEFILVDDKTVIEKLSEAKESGSQFIKGAPFAIVVCGDSTKSDVWVEDCSIATILIQMMAVSLKLGSCWIQMRNRKRADGTTAELYIQQLLGIPDHIKVEAVVAMGLPAEAKKPVPRTDLDYSKIRLNSYREPFPAKAK
jgi:nitroreductase